MPDRPLSERCSLMAKPGAPPPPRERPPECPRDGSYIRTVGKPGTWKLPGDVGVPIVFEGGPGNDSVLVIGSGGAGVIVDGGAGDDRLTTVSEWTWLVGRMSPAGLTLVGCVGIVFAALVTIAWRALRPSSRGRA